MRHWHPARYELSTYNPNNLVIVETQKENVLIRAAQNNFSGRRKAFLIRQLAAEGYIPDRFELYTEDEPMVGLKWVIDRSLMIIGPAAIGRTHKFMQRLIVGSCLALVLEIVLVILSAQ